MLKISFAPSVASFTLHLAILVPDTMLKISFAPSVASFTLTTMCWPVKVPQRLIGTTFIELASTPLTMIVSLVQSPMAGSDTTTSSNSNLNWQMLESHLLRVYEHMPVGAGAG